METRLSRLAGRGMDADQARARMRAQATDEQRRAIADYLIDNDADLEDTKAQVARVWADLERRAEAAAARARAVPTG